MEGYVGDYVNDVKRKAEEFKEKNGNNVAFTLKEGLMATMQKLDDYIESDMSFRHTCSVSVNSKLSKHDALLGVLIMVTIGLALRMIIA